MDISSHEYDRYTVEPGDLLVCEGGDVGRCALWPYNLPRCGFQKALHRLRPRNARQDLARFLYYALSVASNREAFSDGHVSTIAHLTGEKLRAHRFPFPSFAEQASIVRFLDHVDRHIQRFIRAKQKLIALLDERAHTIIHQATTGQIDVRTGQPYPAYRFSGLEWFGQAPAHWRVVQLRRVTLDYCDGPFGTGLKASHYVEVGIRVVRLQNIGHGEFKDSDVAFISPDHYASLGNHSVLAGDLLIAGLGDGNHPSGRACVAPQSIEPAMVKADCFRFRIDQSCVLPQFVATQLTATSMGASAVLSAGATRQRTNLGSTSARPISFPGLDEQACILDYVDSRVSEIRAAQRTAEGEINVLGEYRKRLAAELVTGALDVRLAASLFPITDAGVGETNLRELL